MHRSHSLSRHAATLVLIVAAPAHVAFAVPFAWIANHADDTVTMIDAASNKPTAPIRVGHRPIGVAVDPEGTRVYVANQDGTVGTVSVIEGRQVVATIPVGDDPTGVAVKLPGTEVYVANRVGKSVSVIDAERRAVVATIPVGDNPLGVAINPAGTPAYVVNKGSDSLTVIDTNTRSVVATVASGPPGGNPTHVAVTPDGDRVYVTNGSGATVSILDAATLALVGSVRVGRFPKGVAFDPDGKRAYVANSGPDTVSVIDTDRAEVVATVPVGDQPEDLRVLPDGRRLYVLNRGESTVSVVDTAMNVETDADGIPSNGRTRIAVGASPVGLGDFVIPALRIPRFAEAALKCQTAIAAQSTKYAAMLGGDSSARIRQHAEQAIMRACGTINPRTIARPCDRGAATIADSAHCVLDQHLRMSAAVAATIATAPASEDRATRACERAVVDGAARFAMSEHTAVQRCLLGALKDAARGKPITEAAERCRNALDPADRHAALTKRRTAFAARIAHRCAATPNAFPIGCGTTPDSAAACVLATASRGVQKMIAAEFNDACPMLVALGLGRAFPIVCTGP